MKSVFTLIVSFFLISNVSMSQSWSLKMIRPDLELTDLKFINANEGFVFGDSSISNVFMTSVILKTTDGGQNWSTYVVGNPNFRITKAFFLNATEGFAAGRSGGGNTGLFLKTNDGGVTWTSPFTFAERAFNVCFLNSATGWVMGKNGLLMKTTDGGISWNAQSVTGEDINSMRFINSTQGVMVCGGAEIFVTSDAGLTWNLVSSSVNEDLIAISIVNNNVWVCGTAGTIVHSDNAGQTWTVQTSTLPVDFNDIAFADNNNGYTAGILGIINQTQDSGTNWQNQNSNCNDEIIAISVPDIYHGWFCTTQGEIYNFVNPLNVAESFVNDLMPSVFPNPAVESITIKAQKISSVRIIDLCGKVWSAYYMLPEYADQTISIGALSPGVYTAEIQADNRIYNLKIIKQ